MLSASKLTEIESEECKIAERYIMHKALDGTTFILERLDKRGLSRKSSSYHGKSGTISSSSLDLSGCLHAHV
jgi:hypothetical protein